MSDDLHNNWGVNLCLVTKRDERTYSSESSELLYDEFKRMISNFFDDNYVLHKVTTDGSSANIFSILEATKGDTTRCLIAAGSYLCSDYTVFHNLITSEFYLSASLSVIREPDEHDDCFTCRSIIALPYAIPGTIKKSRLNAYEDDCLKSLHKKLLFYRIMGKHIKAVFLELVLAGNGASLSDRALEMIAVLAKKHDFTIIVDEIMTGGRTGSMLHLLTKPTNFIKCVSHVTLGKWPKCGLILVTKEHYHAGEQNRRLSVPRGTTTSLDFKRIIPYWNKVVSLLDNAESRRHIVLKRIKCKAMDAWGIGCLIFIPQKNNSINGLKNRILPLIETTPVDSSRIIQPTHNSHINKNRVNEQVMFAILQWKEVSIENPDSQIIGTDTERHYYELICYIINLFEETARTQYFDIEERNILTTEDMHDVLHQKFNINYQQTGIMLRRLELAGLLAYRIAGKKRKRHWLLKEEMIDMK